MQEPLICGHQLQVSHTSAIPCIHYIDKNWNMCCKCLQTHYMPEAHTAVNLQEALTSSLEQWNLDPDKTGGHYN